MSTYRRSKGWTCRRIHMSMVCGRLNPPSAKRCQECGKLRPPKRRPKHLKALELPYEHYVEINGGEFCGVCKRLPEPGKRLQRDHDHRTGEPRGLLCIFDNRKLGSHVTLEWTCAVVAYLERVQMRRTA